ncbi:hypothetical protein VW35_02425 [Devosia soli]|uniref:Uncharacterized protein n=1 Tax=Devosia soli TaxID=361041 RepID=A0A0F5LFD7_9HYPH|nr:hypothetical protein [Devosia soli]KKB81043.1 hypothetical protein VW35_02425 [Devosia soli]
MKPKYTVVFCDDIRQETSGKNILIGVYSGDLLPAVVPGSFPLSVYIKVQGLSGHHRFRMKLTSPNGHIAMEIEDEVEFVPESDSLPLSFQNAVIQVESAGKITVEFTLDDNDPEIIGELAVHIPQTSPAA